MLPFSPHQAGVPSAARQQMILASTNPPKSGAERMPSAACLRAVAALHNVHSNETAFAWCFCSGFVRVPVTPYVMKSKYACTVRLSHEEYSSKAILCVCLRSHSPMHPGNGNRTWFRMVQGGISSPKSDPGCCDLQVKCCTKRVVAYFHYAMLSGHGVLPCACQTTDNVGCSHPVSQRREAIGVLASSRTIIKFYGVPLPAYIRSLHC